MVTSSNRTRQNSDRRQRLHEILIALIQQQDDLELMDPQSAELASGSNHPHQLEPALWLERNRRVLKKYQALVRSAITMDALLDGELNE